MRRKDKLVTDDIIIHEILTKSNVCRIALNDGEYPCIVPLNYGYRDNTLYIHSAPAGKKIGLIRKNNSVSFEIEYFTEIEKHEKSCKWTTKYRSIIGNGKIEIVEDIEGIKSGLDVIMEHHGKFDNTYDEKYLKNMVILKLSIKNLTAKQSGNWD